MEALHIDTLIDNCIDRQLLIQKYVACISSDSINKTYIKIILETAPCILLNAILNHFNKKSLKFKGFRAIED